MSFATTFHFARPAPAPYRDRNGTARLAGVDTARFDHDLGGRPLGLLVTAGAEPGQQDRVRPIAPIGIEGAATVFHARSPIDAGGAIERRAHYTMDADAMIASCLAQIGHHRSIGVVAGFVPIRRGAVRFGGQAWAAPAMIALADGRAIATGNDAALIEG